MHLRALFSKKFFYKNFIKKIYKTKLRYKTFMFFPICCWNFLARGQARLCPFSQVKNFRIAKLTALAALPTWYHTFVRLSTAYGDFVGKS
jgi:hypothetical protein